MIDARDFLWSRAESAESEFSRVNLNWANSLRLDEGVGGTAHRRPSLFSPASSRWIKSGGRAGGRRSARIF